MNTEIYLNLPYFGAAVLEELQELGDKYVERAVKGIRVQGLSRILADFLQSPKSSLQEQHQEIIWLIEPPSYKHRWPK